MTGATAIMQGVKRPRDVSAPGAMAQEGWLPMQGNSTDLDDGFGHWLAGFVDGEGCFFIARSSRGYSFDFRLQVALRADDKPTLEAIQLRTGVGVVRDKREQQRGLGRQNAKPQAVWVVNDQAGCLTLVRIFDRYPLRAKKAADYAVWREAVLEWARVPYLRRVSTTGPSRDWSRVEALCDILKTGRQYSGEWTPVPAADSTQLRLGG